MPRRKLFVIVLAATLVLPAMVSSGSADPRVNRPIEKHRTRATLTLTGGLVASGSVSVPSSTRCERRRTVEIQQRVSGVWGTVATGQTLANGTYVVELPNTSGTYRSKVLRRTLRNGDVCRPARSSTRTYQVGDDGDDGGGQGIFEIEILNHENTETLGRLVHRFVLDTADGWLFGDRVGYHCAYFFLNDGGANMARVTIERIPEVGYISILDRNGVEQNPQTECGSGDAEYEEEEKPADLADTVVRFLSGSSTLEELVFPATSPFNSNVWFELGEATAGEIEIEVYLGVATVATVKIERLSSAITLLVA